MTDKYSNKITMILDSDSTSSWESMLKRRNKMKILNCSKRKCKKRNKKKIMLQSYKMVIKILNLKLNLNKYNKI